jgi:predicted nucleic acid-binding protein
LARFYVDSSAYVTLLLGDPGAAALEKELRDAEILSSSLLLLEAHRTLVHAARAGRLSSEELQRAMERIVEDLELFRLRSLTVELCGAHPMPLASTPRSLDLAHLRTALWFHAESPLTRFVTLDERQDRAARELGLPV